MNAWTVELNRQLGKAVRERNLCRPPSIGHVTSFITWPFDLPYAISYRCSIVTKSVSPSCFWYIRPQTYRGHDLDLSGSCDVIGYVTIQFAICHFQLVVHWNRASISNSFWGIWPKNMLTNTRMHHTNERTNQQTRRIAIPPGRGNKQKIQKINQKRRWTRLHECSICTRNHATREWETID